MIVLSSEMYNRSELIAILLVSEDGLKPGWYGARTRLQLEEEGGIRFGRNGP